MKKKSRFSGKVFSSMKKEKEKESSSSYGYLNIPRGTEVFQAKPGGRTSIDIIPYIVTDPNHPNKDEENGVALLGDGWFTRPFKIHRNIGVSKDTVVCLSSFGKKCPICEYRSRKIKEGAEKEETDAIRASQRNLFVVIPKGQKDLEEVPMIWDISKYNFFDLLWDEIEENPDYDAFPDLDNGYTLKIRFDSLTIGNSQPFAKASRIDFASRDYAYDESIMGEVPNLDKLLKEYSYKELEAMFFELPDEEDDDEEESSPKQTHSRKPVTTKKQEVEDEDEDEDDEEEEDEKPTAKRTRKSVTPKKVEKEEDEDEGDEEEEEEDYTPKRLPKKTASAPVPEKKVVQRTRTKPSASHKCPHGHTFGVDTDQFDECEDCKLWEPCIEEKEK